MNGSRRFVDTNILVYAHDTSAGDKHERARALLEQLWETRDGCLSVQILQEFFVNVTRKIPKPLNAAVAKEDLNHGQLYDGAGVENPFRDATES
jgi:predicted nucleic acid-binding protein